MKILFPAASVGLVLACLASIPVGAQQWGFASNVESHTINPSLSLSAPANSPLQQQMRQDYATGLLGAQRDLLEQNPSGLGRQEQAIGRELNGYIGPRRQSSARTAGDFANPSELRLIGKPSLGCAQY